MNEVINWFYRYAKRKPKLIKQIEKQVQSSSTKQIDKQPQSSPTKQHDPNRLPRGSIYSWIKSLQNSLLGTTSATGHADQRDSQHSNQSDQPATDHYRGVLQTAKDSMFYKLAVRISGTEEDKEFA